MKERIKVSGVHDRFVHELNELMRNLIDDGCFDRANELFELLEEYDLLEVEEDGSDWDDDTEY